MGVVSAPTCRLPQFDAMTLQSDEAHEDGIWTQQPCSRSLPAIASLAGITVGFFLGARPKRVQDSANDWTALSQSLEQVVKSQSSLQMELIETLHSETLALEKSTERKAASARLGKRVTPRDCSTKRVSELGRRGQGLVG